MRALVCCAPTSAPCGTFCRQFRCGLSFNQRSGGYSLSGLRLRQGTGYALSRRGTAQPPSRSDRPGLRRRLLPAAMAAMAWRGRRLRQQMQKEAGGRQPACNKQTPRDGSELCTLIGGCSVQLREGGCCRAGRQLHKGARGVIWWPSGLHWLCSHRALRPPPTCGAATDRRLAFEEFVTQ